MMQMCDVYVRYETMFDMILSDVYYRRTST
jgi:hypothetical protein